MASRLLEIQLVETFEPKSALSSESTISIHHEKFLLFTRQPTSFIIRLRNFQHCDIQFIPQIVDSLHPALFPVHIQQWFGFPTNV